MRMGDATSAARDVMAVSTGSLGLDIALGIGGLPRGRVTEIYGPESSGKTTLALGSSPKPKSWAVCAAFIDAEHALDPIYAAKLGVSVDDLLVSPARHRRAGAGNRRHVGAFRRGGPWWSIRWRR